MRRGSLFLASLLLVSACSDSERAETVETTIVTAPSTMRSAPTLRVAAWDDAVISSLCIETTEDYDRIANRTPIREGLADAFRDDDVGVEVVQAGCDAVLTVAATGRPLSASYTGNTLFTGASVNGTVTLSAAGATSLEASFSGHKPTPNSVTYFDSADLPREPWQAPLWDVASDGICTAFTQWFSDSPTRLIELVHNLRTTTTGCGGWVEPVVIPFLDQ
jgi:hypothetical protein